MVGEPIRGRKVVDVYDDKVQTTALQGDHWRTRHNAMLHLLHRLCLKVFNLFSCAIKQPGLSREEKCRVLQGLLVPDMPGEGGGGGEVAERVGGEAVAGQATPVLHEIKVISY